MLCKRELKKIFVENMVSTFEHMSQLYDIDLTNYC